ncbi:MAG: hypothetical protein ACKVVP_21025 [Chloroflexota bacterium]
MQKETHHIDLDSTSTSDLLRVAREVQRSGIATIIRADGEEIAQVTPTGPHTASPLPKKRVGVSDWIKPLISMGAGKAPHDVSENVDTYLAQAYAE